MMLDIVSNVIHNTEKLILKRVLRVVALVVLGILLIATAFAWVTVAIYMQLAQWLLPWQAAAAIAACAFIAGGAVCFMASIKKPRKQPENDTVKTLVQALMERPAGTGASSQGKTGHSATETALITALVGLVLYDNSRRSS